MIRLKSEEKLSRDILLYFQEKKHYPFRKIGIDSVEAKFCIVIGRQNC